MSLRECGVLKRRTNNGRQRDFRLLTIPHTGTMFTLSLLEPLGLDLETHHSEDLGFPMPFVAEGKCVVPVRDPLMAEISRLNRGWGHPVERWEIFARWKDKDTVHFFRVDGPEDERDEELDSLAAFVGVDTIEADWKPVNTSPDRLGLKPRYLSGEIPDELRPAYEWLRDADGVQALFRSLGYDLPWMP